MPRGPRSTPPIRLRAISSASTHSHTAGPESTTVEPDITNTACDLPPSYARTTDFIGHVWPEQLIAHIPKTTTMPLSSEIDRLDTSHGAERSISSTTTSPSSTTAVEVTSYESSIDKKVRRHTQSPEHPGATETSMPLTPNPGSVPELSSAFGGVSARGRLASSFVRTALPLLLNMGNSETQAPAGGIAPNPLASTLARDSLLIYAHRIFNSSAIPGAIPGPLVSKSASDLLSPEHPYNSQLLPLLQRLRTLHPNHLPTLLLLGCVQYAVGNYEESLALNEEMLRLDENYVEAMSNLGTTLKAMGRTNDAIQWWWKAVFLRPNYWDAVNNLLGILVSFEQEQVTRPADRTYVETLRLCETVQSRIVDRHGNLLIPVPAHNLHNLQNIYYVSGSIRCLSGKSPNYDGLCDFALAIETMLHVNSPASGARFNFKEFLMAACVAGLMASSALPETISELTSTMGYLDSPRKSQISEFNAIEFARHADDKLWQLIVAEGDGTFPAIFLSPKQATEMSSVIFQKTFGIFPSLCTWSDTRECFEKPAEGVALTTNEMASNVLLSIAKLVQESKSTTMPLPRFEHWVRSGPSLILLLYYLAYTVFPSPSACNNLGIILSTTPWKNVSEAKAMELAKQFYGKGLELDGAHAHLLTNMGSLLKEAGDIDAAIEMYSRAVQANPNFDVALANLANAIKDSGRLADSIAIYRRAVEINNDLSEALCGLAHASWSICDWRGFGRIDSEVAIDAEGNHFAWDASQNAFKSGWMPKLIETTQKQLAEVYQQNIDVVKTTGSLEDWLSWIEESVNTKLDSSQRKRWISILQPFYKNTQSDRHGINEGSFMIRIVEWLTRHLQWRWYVEAFGHTVFASSRIPALNDDAIRETASVYSRPHLPPSMSLQLMPSVLPFHTFIYPLSAREIRLIAHRNALRVSHSALTRPWLPEHVYPPPPPPSRKINIGYISSDFMDHPTAHLVSSVFGMHDKAKFRVFAYALSESDGSSYREKIEGDAETFRDVSSWPTQSIVEQIVRDEIHILVNLNGYTKGARNDIFAARPSPVQILFLGFAGTLASCWVDYIICDPVACPPSTRKCDFCDEYDLKRKSSSKSSADLIDFDFGPDPDSIDEWKYVEKLMYMPHTYLVTDHKQRYGSPSVEGNNGISSQEQWRNAEDRRRKLRRKLFPDLVFDETIIFANFNQLDPSTFAAWLRIMKRVPNSILWLLRFPPAGEEHLIRTARQWAGDEVANRVRFTDVAKKDEHIDRARAADIFLDTVECNAHTVAADVLWGGTPIITWPKYDYKMCSRVGASIAFATGFGQQMVVDSLAAYEERAVSLALSVTPKSFGRAGSRTAKGELTDLRRNLFLNREKMPLFDCLRWTRNLEKGYIEAWERWVRGGTTSHFNVDENSSNRYKRCNGFIWIRDEDT